MKKLYPLNKILFNKEPARPGGAFKYFKYIFNNFLFKKENNEIIIKFVQSRIYSFQISDQ